MATTTLTGNLAADPVLRSTANGRPVCNFTVIENRRKRDANSPTGWSDDEPLSMRCTLWGDHATNFAESVKRGQRVTVTGTLTPRSYVKDDETRHTIELMAEDASVSLRFARASVERVSRSVPDGVPDAWTTEAGATASKGEPPF